MPKSAPCIKIDTIYAAYNILNSRANNIFTQEYIDDLFERLCVRLSLFNQDKQKVILDLLSRYVFIPFIEYVKYFLVVFHDSNFINNCLKKGVKEVYVTSLYKQKKDSTFKGSELLLLLIEIQQSLEQEFKAVGIECHFLSFNELCFIKQTDNIAVLFVEDYIGSGQTADRVISDFLEDSHFTLENINIIAIAACNKGLDYLIDKYECLNIYIYLKQDRCISDHYSEEQSTEIKSMMNEIETRLNVPDRFKFGYKQSEGLLSLNRTPNNTLPFFWHRDNKNRVLFERY